MEGQQNQNIEEEQTNRNKKKCNKKSLRVAVEYAGHYKENYWDQIKHNTN